MTTRTLQIFFPTATKNSLLTNFSCHSPGSVQLCSSVSFVLFCYFKTKNKISAPTVVSSAAGCVGATYHCSCVSDGPGVQRAGARGAADAVRMADADSWTGHHGGRDATGCWFDSLLRGLGQGLLTVQQRQPQGRKAFLLTGREETKREGERRRERGQRF